MKKLVFFGLLIQADQLPVGYGDYAITREEDCVTLRYKGGLVEKFIIWGKSFDEIKVDILSSVFGGLRLSDKFAGITDFSQTFNRFGDYVVLREDKVFKLVLETKPEAIWLLGSFELTDTQIEVFSRDVLAFAKYLRYEVL